jgi:hypothetical protein
MPMHSILRRSPHIIAISNSQAKNPPTPRCIADQFHLSVAVYNESNLTYTTTLPLTQLLLVLGARPRRAPKIMPIAGQRHPIAPYFAPRKSYLVQFPKRKHMEGNTVPRNPEENTTAEMMRESPRRRATPPEENGDSVLDGEQVPNYRAMSSSGRRRCERAQQEEQGHEGQRKKWFGRRWFDAFRTWEQDHIEFVLENKRAVARDHLGISFTDGKIMQRMSGRICLGCGRRFRLRRLGWLSRNCFGCRRRYSRERRRRGLTS